MLPDYEKNPVKLLSFKILIAKVTFISFSLAFDKKQVSKTSLQPVNISFEVRYPFLKSGFYFVKWNN